MLRRAFLLLMFCGLAAATTFLVAADDPPQDQSAPPAGADETTTEPDPFAVPEGTDSQVLGLFLQRLSRTPPKERTPEGITSHLNKLDEVAKEITSRDVDDDLYTQTAKLRFQVLSMLEQFGDETAAQRHQGLLKELQNSPRPAAKQLASQLEFVDRVSKLMEMATEQQNKLVSDAAEMLKTADAESESMNFSLQIAMQIASNLERVDPQQGAAAYEAFASVLKGRNDDQFANIVQEMEASTRRLNLPGNSIEVSGTTIDGQPFNITQYNGRVVLVDFWATWCGPCLAELPHVKEMYEAYHDRGFEVVGISLDEDRETLEEFLENEELAWVTLFENEDDKRGWSNPIARHYGISGIPTAILVNQEGKVVNLNARGQILTDELAKLLGPLKESKEEQR